MSIFLVQQNLPIIFRDHPSAQLQGDDFAEDLLGLFVGDPYGAEAGMGNSAPPQIILFIDNLFEEAEGDLDLFREEVRQTFLHELGHYLGWDEDELEARGLA